MSRPSTVIPFYDQPHQFEPLLPQQALGPLVERTRVILEKAYRLQHAVAPCTRQALRRLVRGMNSYYSNRIEGQGTHPANIERALRADFSASPEVARRQRLALAHMEAEEELESGMAPEAGRAGIHALHSSILLRSHEALYCRLAVADRTTDDGRVITPGQLRNEDVSVGRHQPPVAASVPAFLARMDEVYPRIRGLDALLYGIAAAHHRAAWVHPFGDGNGRACRLQTHCALLPVTAGLWSVNRGLARQREKYYEMLANADSPRQGDLDGRGNLSERQLRDWCEFFLDVAEDQVNLMTGMLELEALRDRIAALVAIRSASAQYAHYSPHAVIPLHYVLVAGPVSRGDFIQMTGMPERSGRRVLSQLLKDGLLASDGPKGAVSFNFPLDALNILLPNLYPEAAAANMEP